LLQSPFGTQWWASVVAGCVRHKSSRSITGSYRHFWTLCWLNTKRRPRGDWRWLLANWFS